MSLVLYVTITQLCTCDRKFRFHVQCTAAPHIVQMPKLGVSACVLLNVVCLMWYAYERNG